MDVARGPSPWSQRLSASVLTVVVLVTSGLLTGCSDDIDIDRGVAYGDQPEQVADIYRPDETLEDRVRKNRPAVVLVHGGGWEEGSKKDVAADARALAEEGFVAIAIDYRMPPVGQRWTMEADDVRAAVRWVQEHASDLWIDASRVGIYGSSAGGNLAMLVAVTGVGDSSLPPLKAVASWSGPADLASLTPPDGKPNPAVAPPGCGSVVQECIGVLDPGAIVDYLNCTPTDCPDTYADASPTSHVEKASPPMFLAAAEIDFVPYAQVDIMAAALRSAGVEAVTVKAPGEGHAESLHDQLIDPTIDFFKEKL